MLMKTLQQTIVGVTLMLLSCGWAIAKGPTGFGSLKLGMAREAVEALQASDSVHLAAPLTPYQYKNATPKPGEDKYDAQLVTPLSPQPLKAVLTFESERLTALYLNLDTENNVLEVVKNQITEKYGSPKVDDSMKEEQCIYKNGSNFKLSSGAISHKWLEETPGAAPIETSLSDVVVAMCPSNLRYGSIGPIKLRSLSVRFLKGAPDQKPKNLF